MLGVKLLGILLLVAPGVLGKGYLMENLAHGDIYCNPTTNLVANISFHYFADQHSLTMINALSKSITSVMKCFKGNQFRPMNFFNDLKLIDSIPRTSSSSVCSHSLTHGFLLKISSVDVEEALGMISKLNPRSKLMVFLSDETEKVAERVLFEAYHKFKMLTVAVTLINDVYKNEGSVETTITVIMYNPFAQTIYDQLVKFPISHQNILETCKQMDSFMMNRLRNLQGFPFRVNIFDYPMISKAVRNEQGKITHYSYVDGDTLTAIGKRMNFTPVYDETSNNRFLYGFQYPNGTFVGSLADVEYDRVELVANPRLISDAYNTTNSVFLQPITMVRLSFIIQRRKTTKMLMISIFGQYDTSSKIIAISLTVLFPVLYAMVKRYEDGILAPEQQVESFIKSVLYSFALQNNVSMKHSPFTSTRIIVTTILFHTLIISALFQSTIVKNLNTKQRIGKINQISELIEQGYEIKMPGYLAMTFKTSGLDKVSKMMESTKQTYASVAAAHGNLQDVFSSKKKIAFLWTDLYNTNYLNQFFDPETGENLYENVPEIAFEFYISLMAPKHSPFIEIYNEVLQSYVESGIGAHHVGFAYYDNDKVLIRRIREGKMPKPSDGAIKFEDLRVPFEVQLYLCLVCCFVFLVEVIWQKIRKSRLSNNEE
jgi:hypothetical protein